MASVFAIAAVAVFGVKPNRVAAVLFDAALLIVSEFLVGFEAAGTVTHVAPRQWQGWRLPMTEAGVDQRFGRIAADCARGHHKPGAPGGDRGPGNLGRRTASAPARGPAPQDYSCQDCADRNHQPKPGCGVHGRVWWDFILVMGPQLSRFVNCRSGRSDRSANCVGNCDHNNRPGSAILQWFVFDGCSGPVSFRVYRAVDSWAWG